MFRRLSGVWGSMSPVIEGLVARDIEALFDELLVEALSRWHDSGWHRFDDREINCTIQLFRHADDAGRDVRRLRVLSMSLEWSQPTPGMLAGVETATTMGRPD